MSVDPIRDMEIITEELCLKDMENVDKALLGVQNKIDKMNNKEAKEEKEVLVKVKAILEENKWITSGNWN